MPRSTSLSGGWTRRRSRIVRMNWGAMRVPTVPGRRDGSPKRPVTGARLLDMSDVFAIADRYVDAIAALDPISATGAGIAGHDDELTDYSPAGAAARAQLARDTLQELADGADRVRQRPHRGRGDDGTAAGHDRPVRSRRAAARPPGDRQPGRIDPVVLRPHGLRHAGRLGDRARAHGRASRRRVAELRSVAARGHGARHRRVAPPGARVRGAGRDVERRRAVLPQRRRPAPGRAAPRRRGRSRDRSRTRSSRSSCATSTRRRPTRATRSARAVRAVGARVQRHRARLRGDLRSGAGTSCTASRTRCGASANASCPASRLGEVIEHLDRDATRAIDGVDEFQRWNQDLIDTTIAELDGTHFDIAEPLHRCEAMIAPPGGAAAMYYTGPSEDFSRPGPHVVPDAGQHALPAVARGHDLLPRSRPRPSPAGRPGALPRRQALAVPACVRVRVRARRGVGAVRRAADGRARLPRGSRPGRWACSRRRRCARCA